MKQGQLIIAVLLVCAIIPFSASDGHNRSVNIAFKTTILFIRGRDGPTGRDGLPGPPGATGRNELGDRKETREREESLG